MRFQFVQTLKKKKVLVLNRNLLDTVLCFFHIYLCNKHLNHQETLTVMKGVAQGLQTLHGANIVHGSLHGNNVFVVNRKQGIVGDFDFTKSEVKNP